MAIHEVAPPELSKLRKSYAWRKLSAKVKAEQPICRLQLDGCTQVTTCVDHIIPASQRIDLFLVESNCQGSCNHCNITRGLTPISALKDLREPPALSFFDVESFDSPGFRRGKP